MRLWLTGAFAAVSLVTAATVYFFGDNHQALMAAVLIGVLAGFVIAVAISTGSWSWRGRRGRWRRAPSTRR